MQRKVDMLPTEPELFTSANVVAVYLKVDVKKFGVLLPKWIKLSKLRGNNLLAFMVNLYTQCKNYTTKVVFQSEEFTE